MISFEVIKVKENEEVLMENVSPEDLPTEEEKEGEKPFVPSSMGKRVLAWFLFAVMVLGICTWLLNIAYPEWIDVVRAWFGA